jgi:tRNA G10  N-methylase Trm11
MKEVSYSEYLEYISRNRRVVVEDQEVLLEPIEVKRQVPVDEELTDISTTVWSFPTRGSWAPQMARALIEMYTEPGDLVLDPMVGSGTTCIEARLLGRNCIGVDISYGAVILSLHRLYWLERVAEERFKGSPVSANIARSWSKIYYGDARRLSLLNNNSVDLVATHPP